MMQNKSSLGPIPFLAVVFTWQWWDCSLGLSFMAQDLQISQWKQNQTLYCALFLLAKVSWKEGEESHPIKFQETPCCQDTVSDTAACWGQWEFESTQTPAEDAQSFAGRNACSTSPCSCPSFAFHCLSFFSVGVFATAFSHSSASIVGRVWWSGQL